EVLRAFGDIGTAGDGDIDTQALNLTAASQTGNVFISNTLPLSTSLLTSGNLNATIQLANPDGSVLSLTQGTGGLNGTTGDPFGDSSFLGALAQFTANSNFGYNALNAELLGGGSGSASGDAGGFGALGGFGAAGSSLGGDLTGAAAFGPGAFGEGGT